MTSSNNPHHKGDPKAIQDLQEGWGKRFLPKGVNIVWGGDGRYWKVEEQEAELLQVCWLEVTGSADIDSTKDYQVTFTISLTADAFGWAAFPVYIMVKKGKDSIFASRKYNLTSFEEEKFKISCPTKSKSTPTTADNKLYFGLYEVWSGRWKGGLKIHEVIVQEIQPSNTYPSSSQRQVN